MLTSLQDAMVSVRRKLLANPKFSSLIGVDIGRDGVGEAYNDGWVFQATNTEMIPDRNPRNSGLSAVVYSMRGTPWTGPNDYNDLGFRTLTFRILSDSTRDPSDTSLLIQKDADYRCDRIASAIIATFDDVANNDHNWPNGVTVVSSRLWDDLVIDDVPETDGLVEGDLSFALALV